MLASESRKLQKTERVSGDPGLHAALGIPQGCVSLGVFPWGNPIIADHLLVVSWWTSVAATFPLGAWLWSTGMAASARSAWLWAQRAPTRVSG